MILLILVGVWAAVLGPSLLRRRFDHRSSDSIGEFHHHLRVLRRTGPTLVAPAFRLVTSLPDALPLGQERPVTGSGRGLILIRPDAQDPLMPTTAIPTRRPERYFRPEARKRRRDVLLSLVSVIFVTGVLGAIPLLRPILGVTLFALVVATVYVVMVVRLGVRAAERVAKLRYLPEPVEEEPTIVIRRAAR